MLVVLIVASALAAAPALAAPEKPELEVSYRARESLSVRGFLNPKAEGEEGTYEFFYKEGSSCEGGRTTPRGLSFQFEHEEVSEKLPGLEPGTEYTVCLLVRNLKGETNKSAPVTVRTTTRTEVPEAPKTEAEGGVSNTGATLEGVVNPKSSVPVTWFFEYNKGSSCTGGGRTPAQPSEALELQAQTVQVGVGGLESGKEYSYCLVARNEEGQEAAGAPQSFTTTALAPSVSEESVLSVNSSRLSRKGSVRRV
jgi:hypothetical protein